MKDPMEILLDGAGQPATNGQGGGADLIKEGSSQTFLTDVIEASKQVPVIVDFWATWCEPCKTLGPMLEKCVRELRGAVKMVKIDIDKNQDLAGQLRIQSVPTVYAFVNGQPADGFQGALPESQIKQFLGRLTGGAGSALDEALDHADQALADGNSIDAKEIYSSVLQEDTTNARAIAGLLKLMIADGNLTDARATADRLPDDLKAKPEIISAIATLDLAEQGGAADNSELETLKQAVDANPKDNQAAFDYAVAAFAVGQSETAVDVLLDLFKRDRAWKDEVARTQLLKIFEALGHTDPVTQDGRKRLSSILFS